MEIADKNIVLTGGTSGIGLELVRKLSTGNSLWVIGRPSPRLTALRQDVDGIHLVEADLSDNPQLEQAADLIAKQAGRIDILINNAAIQNTPHFLDDEFCAETIAREIQVNFTAPCTLIHCLLPAMLGTHLASIVNINSGLGLVPKTSSAVYCGTKGALNIFSMSLGHQLADTNVKVMQAFLPLVDTKMTAGRGTGKLSAAEAAEEIIKAIESRRGIVDIGKVRLLRMINRLSPSLAARIMKRA